MPGTHPLFEDMLATYPADKRELARSAYNRFVDGDTTHFFTQLFLLLDVYANYANRIPLTIHDSNQITLASLKKIREEIGLLAQAVEKRGVDMGNVTEETSKLCLQTQEKCEAAAQRLEKLTKDIASQVDTKAIIESIHKSIDAGLQADVIKPFMQRSEELATEVLPTLEKIRRANEEAERIWPGRIWKMALACGLVLGLAVAIVGTGAAYLKIKSHYYQRLAEQISATEKTLTQNQEAFRQLAVADIPIRVLPVVTGDQRIPGGFALVIEDVQKVEERANGERKDGYLFFASQRAESELQRLSRETEEAARKRREATK